LQQLNSTANAAGFRLRSESGPLVFHSGELIMQKYFIAVLSAALLLGSTLTHAATAQQNKMTTCNADAKTNSLQGQARKDFMKSCLSAEGAPAAKVTTQQEKMKSCNAEAGTKTLKGQERKTFMKTCLSAA
jgi:psiF repeat